MNENMKQEDFLLIMELIDGAYNGFKLTENTIKSYYHFLKGYVNKDVWYAVTNWIENNDYPPTIHNLLVQLGAVKR